MQPLEKSLRNKLERTVKDARDIAETAAKAVLEQLGVGEAAPFAHLSEDEKTLRRRLRVHGRQLGDSLNGGKVQTTERLVEEIAYEHWHRMLFARFLAENNLLMYPDPDNPVAVSLEECEDLAADEGAKNGWELAARFAARMLPQIFRTDSPVFQLQFAANHQLPLEKLLADLPREVFTASDSLGWVYQFWQAKRKDEVNASEVKIGARELPAVTQLFTEPYMVAFLLDNSLGAWWAARRLSSAGLMNAKSEEELRAKASLPGVPLEYLRFIRVPVPSPLEGEGEGEGEIWTPAAGTFDGWPKSLKELKTLDPCCGSGHFLVAAFLMLVAMRMELEGLSARESVDAVLRDNIHGLEIDKRCVELAAFALALTAWRYNNAGGYRPLPELNVACSGLAISAKKEEWLALAGRNANLRNTLDKLYNLFMNAPVLGSLLNPARLEADLYTADYAEAAALLNQALSQEQTDEQHEAGVVAQGLAKAATLLAGKYHWVITNVPYLARSKQIEALKDFCEKQYPEAKNDLATVFLDRCLELCAEGGTYSIVLPQNWLFLTSYKKFREKLLTNDTWHMIARLGPGAFETISGEVVKAILITLSRGRAKGANGLFAANKSSNLIRSLDVSELHSVAEKAARLRITEIKQAEQVKQLENPDARVALENSDNSALLLKEFAECYQGLRTGDRNRFVHFFWENFGFVGGWIPFQNSSPSHRHYDGLFEIVFWQNGKGELHLSAKERIKHIAGMHESGNRAWGKNGIAMNLMSDLGSSLYMGTKFDGNLNVLFPKDTKHLTAIWTYCSSAQYKEKVRKIDQKLSITNATLLKVPFDLDHWTKVAAEKYPNGLPKPYSDEPTQWIFHGYIAQSDNPLQVAVARLLGYRWPAETTSPPGPLSINGEGEKSDQEVHSTFSALNSPLHSWNSWRGAGGEVDLSDEALDLVKKSADLLSFADDDGIVCIPPVRGESSASDCLLNLLAAAYGNAWSNDTLSELLNQADHAGKTLDTWLRDKFFLQHCKLFQHRPFIWHIWDGLRDGFAALVNYHKLDHKNLETLIYTYLGDWISRQKDDIKSGVDGAAENLAAAEQLKKKLELILEGEAPYDIFVRWKPLEKQPIGWNHDINDGVRLNIRPFMTAGVLRFNKKPQINITWDKDRGKDVESAPWFKVFKGDRINDHHLSLEEKRRMEK